MLNRQQIAEAYKHAPLVGPGAALALAAMQAKTTVARMQATTWVQVRGRAA